MSKQYSGNWEVFIQTKPGLDHKHVGNVQANSAEAALKKAKETYPKREESTCIWVVPSIYVYSTEGLDQEALFDPSADKMYRHATFYVIPPEVKNM